MTSEIKMKKSFKESAEKVLSELIDELIEKQEKQEEIDDRIMVSTEIKKFNSKLIKEMFLNEADEEEK